MHILHEIDQISVFAILANIYSTGLHTEPKVRTANISTYLILTQFCFSLTKQIQDWKIWIVLSWNLCNFPAILHRKVQFQKLPSWNFPATLHRKEPFSKQKTWNFSASLHRKEPFSKQKTWNFSASLHRKEPFLKQNKWNFPATLHRKEHSSKISMELSAILHRKSS